MHAELASHVRLPPVNQLVSQAQLLNSAPFEVVGVQMISVVFCLQQLIETALHASAMVGKKHQSTKNAKTIQHFLKSKRLCLKYKNFKII